MNMSGENDVCVFATILAAEEKKRPNPSSSPAGGDPAATTVTRTNTVGLNNWIAGTSR